MPGVVSVGRSGIGVATDNNNNTGVQLPGRTEPVNIGNYSVDVDFFRTMGIQLVAGRLFDRNRPGDDSTMPCPARTEVAPRSTRRAMVARGINVVINELAAQRMGFRNPPGGGRQDRRRHLFRPRGRARADPHHRRRPRLALPLDPRADRSDHVPARPDLRRHPAGPLRRARSRRPRRVNVERAWRRLAPDVPYDGIFSEDKIAELYTAEQARAKVFAGFAILAVIVACLGLFGLAAFTAERRTKEIGIRKVLGARTRDIVRLLAWQFSKPVLIANLIAWPVAWWAMRYWLNTFDARIDLGPAAVRAGRPARAGDRDRHHRRPRLQGRPRQPDPRPALRMTA